MKRLGKYEVRIDPEGDMKIPATVYISEGMSVEQGAINQLKNAACLPGTVRVLATPDIHQGYGVPIGSVVGCTDIVIPAAVGYDINCGMRVHVTPFDKNDFPFKQLANAIHRHVPLGEGQSNVVLDRGPFERVLRSGVRGLLEVAKSPGRKHRLWDILDPDEEEASLTNIEDNGSMKGEPEHVGKQAIERGHSQLGTLGGGNHFIEIQFVETVYDDELAGKWGLEADRIVLMIHSGSRGLGHQVGGDYMKLASHYNERRKDYRPARDLSYFERGSTEAKQYMGAMRAAANFSYANRAIMAVFTKHAVRTLMGDAELPLVYEVPHNIAKEEDHLGRSLIVHRKGATRAFGPRRMAGTPFSQSGQPVLIPGSMGTSSYVLAGVDGNDDSLASVNHGAGRVMSRTQAAGKRKKKKVIKQAAITDDEFKRSMKGIVMICEDPRSIKEEAPQAYKNIDEVIEAVVGAKLSRPVARMRPLAVLKG